MSLHVGSECSTEERRGTDNVVLCPGNHVQTRKYIIGTHVPHCACQEPALAHAVTCCIAKTGIHLDYCT